MTGPAPFDLDSFLAALPARPGVYRMLGGDDTILYIGKARHLKNRVSSYFHGRTHADKTLALLGQVKRIEVTVTASETEALLLEFNLIKRHRPRYNVLLKDDKSFPYIHLTVHEFPRLAYYRGTRKLPGRFFGPYPNSVAARETLQLLQKLFRIRPCEDTFFANRSRPCLQHQIGRCSAPCVGLVTRESYAQDIADAAKVLEGRNTELITDLGRRMEAAAERLQFEAAARFRDQIAMLKQIQASQSVTRIAGRDIDAVAIAGRGPEYCVAVVFVRGGRNLGSTNFFPGLVPIGDRGHHEHHDQQRRHGLQHADEQLAEQAQPLRKARQQHAGRSAEHDADQDLGHQTRFTHGHGVLREPSEPSRAAWQHALAAAWQRASSAHAEQRPLRETWPASRAISSPPVAAPL